MRLSSQPARSGQFLFLLLSLALALQALFSPVGAQTTPVDGAVSRPFGGEFRFGDNYCLTEEKRDEIHERIRQSVAALEADGRLAPVSPLKIAAPSFVMPVRGLNGAAADAGVYGISNFVDHNAAFPNQLQDYNCGTRTYDQPSGYNHKGIDIFTWPFGWNKMDRNEAAIVAAAAGTIIFKSDGHFDRSCGFNNNNWNAVYLRHDDGTVSWYGHMKNGSLTNKAVGSAVAQGEYLGVVGSSGNSTGPHLHFEIYDPENRLQDPYQGACNPLNNFSYWQTQPAYRDSRINKLMTHSAPPSFPTCPTPEVENARTVFRPGETIRAAAYYRDQTTGQSTQYAILRPNGSAFASWSHASPSTYNASYWFWNVTLPAGTEPGVWKFRAVYGSQTVEHSFTVVAAGAPFDFDGDRRSDLAVFRPSNATWYYYRSTNNTFAGVQFGLASDRLAPADYDGDGRTDLAVWRASDQNFYIFNSSNSSVRVENFGLAGDTLAVADWDGDGRADPAVFRDGAQAHFYFRGSLNNPAGNISYLPWGTTGDEPVRGDFDGDGRADAAVFRPSNGVWYILESANNQPLYVQWGLAADRLVAADYDADGRTDPAVYRDGTWYIRQSSNNLPRYEQFGLASDVPVPADYDGDGRTDPAVFRNGDWYLLGSASNFTVSRFGAAGDTPVAGVGVEP